jgi:hypothetical protein
MNMPTATNNTIRQLGGTEGTNTLNIIPCNGWKVNGAVSATNVNRGELSGQKKNITNRQL